MIAPGFSDEYPENTEPIDLDEVHPSLQNNDFVHQDDIYQGVNETAMRSALELDNFEARPLKILHLTDLRADYQSRSYGTAIYNMRQYRCQVQIEDRDKMLQNNPKTIWNADADRRLDYICAMGNQLGVHAALSNRENDLEYEFVIQILPHMSFSGKYAQLGADQKESLLRIGSRTAWSSA